MLWNSYLVTVMGLVTPWSVTLALMEAYSIIVQKLPMQATVISVIVAGDFVSYLCVQNTLFHVRFKTQNEIVFYQTMFKINKYKTQTKEG